MVKTLESDLDEFNKVGAEFSSGMSQSEISVHKQEVRQIWITSAKPQKNKTHMKHLKNIFKLQLYVLKIY